MDTFLSKYTQADFMFLMIAQYSDIDVRGQQTVRPNVAFHLFFEVKFCQLVFRHVQYFTYCLLIQATTAEPSTDNIGCMAHKS